MRSEKGQAFVLASLTLFILAAMTMVSFNLGNAIHERIRIQHHADAVAYSMAVTTARTFNYFAYTNRAIAANYAAMSTMHAYMASITVTYSLLKAAEANFWVIFAIEIAKVATRWCGPFPCAFEHIPHAITALREVKEYRDKAKDQADLIADADASFQSTIKWLTRMNNLIHMSQATMGAHAAGIVSRLGSLGGDDPIDTLDEMNAPNAEWATGVSLMNGNNVSCAVDGMPCIGDAPDDVSDEQRRKVMAHVADGTRAEWTAKRPMFPVHIATFIFGDLTPEHHDIPGLPLGHKGTARLVDSNDKDDLHNSSTEDGAAEPFEGGVVGGDEHGGILLNLGDCWKPFPSLSVMPYRAEVFTNPDGGRHYSLGGFFSSTDGDFHDDGSDHDEFDGIETASNRAACIVGSGLCFMKFRADSDPDNHFGQPALYAAYVQDLGLLHEGGTLDGGKRAAWEINDDGEIRIQGPNIRRGTVEGGMDIEDGVQTSALTLRPGDGVAVSKALVYYHRMGNWREQPNFFNPYWRAKLHPFTSELEYTLVTTAAGRIDAEIVHAAQTILPGG